MEAAYTTDLYIKFFVSPKFAQSFNFSVWFLRRWAPLAETLFLLQPVERQIVEPQLLSLGQLNVQPVGIVMGFAVGFSGVWVWVETFVPPQNPYPSHG